MNVLEQEKKPCIFGEEIHVDCSVRRNLAGKPNLSKWIKPKSAMLEETKQLLDTAIEALGIEATALAKFCEICPYLNHFEQKLLEKIE